MITRLINSLINITGMALESVYDAVSNVPLEDVADCSIAGFLVMRQCFLINSITLLT